MNMKIFLASPPKMCRILIENAIKDYCDALEVQFKAVFDKMQHIHNGHGNKISISTPSG